MADGKTLAEGLKRGKVVRESGDLKYLRFREGFRGVERGTAVIGKRVVWGFPHIKRVFTLERGLKRNISAEKVFAEEKIDGFNVRVIWHEGAVWAFSRGGFLDLFTTEKARGMKLEKFFRANPDYVLCGEMIGNTPHTPPAKGYDVRLYVFDIDEGDGEYLPCAKRHALLKKYGIQGVPVLGHYSSDDYAGLKRLFLAINKGRKEGMVLKSEDRSEAIKYVTPWSDIDDIAHASGMFYDMPIGFYYQRILRSAFSISDFGLGHDEYSKRLGQALYGGLVRSIRNAAGGKGASEEFEISFRDPRIWDDVRMRMGREVKIEELWRREEGGKTRLRFSKTYRKTSKMLISLAGGKGVTD